MTTREVVRVWRGERRPVVQVSTIHPQVGELFRGTIRPEPSDGWQGRWLVQDCEWSIVGDREEPMIGDYLDAEQALLAATAGLDEPVPDEEER